MRYLNLAPVERSLRPCVRLFVATQHSLPSGRYPLLGPDFHRLDRTSLRLAHSFDHLVGARQERLRLWHEVCAPSRLAYGRSRMRTPFIYRAGCRTSGALLFFAGWRALRPRKTEAAF